MTCAWTTRPREIRPIWHPEWKAAAQPGTVLVAEATYRLVGDAFEFEPHGKIPIKGKEKPVAVYRLKDKAFKARARSEREVYSEMVGRDQELDRLELQILKAVNGEGSVVNVVGEAGIGKSRLMAELKKARCRETGDAPGRPGHFHGQKLEFLSGHRFA